MAPDKQVVAVDIADAHDAAIYVADADDAVAAIDNGESPPFTADYFTIGAAVDPDIVGAVDTIDPFGRRPVGPAIDLCRPDPVLSAILDIHPVGCAAIDALDGLDAFRSLRRPLGAFDPLWAALSAFDSLGRPLGTLNSLWATLSALDSLRRTLNAFDPLRATLALDPLRAALGTLDPLRCPGGSLAAATLGAGGLALAATAALGTGLALAALLGLGGLCLVLATAAALGGHWRRDGQRGRAGGKHPFQHGLSPSASQTAEKEARSAV